MKIAKDIINAINSRSQDEKTSIELIDICKEIYDMNINVGHDQLIRAMLQISDFDTGKFLEIKDSNFLGDPRDVIMQAQNQNNSINYGINKFE